MPGHELMLHPAVEQRLTLEALAAAAGLHSGLVEQFVAYGLLEPVSVLSRWAEDHGDALLEAQDADDRQK